MQRYEFNGSSELRYTKFVDAWCEDCISIGALVLGLRGPLENRYNAYA